MKIGQSTNMAEPGPSSSTVPKSSGCSEISASSVVSSLFGSSESIEPSLEIALTPEKKVCADSTQKKTRRKKKTKKTQAGPNSPTVIIELSDTSPCGPAKKANAMFSFTGGRYAQFASTTEDVVLPAYSTAMKTFGPPEFKFSNTTDSQANDNDITHEQAEKWGIEIADDPRATLAILAMCHADPRTCVFRAMHDSSVTKVQTTEYYGLHPAVAGSPLPMHQYCGRPYLFAGTSLARLALIHKYNLVLEGSHVQCVRAGKPENRYVAPFELSEAYLFFWDRLEKSAHFLDQVTAAQKATGSLAFVHDPDMASSGLSLWADPLPDRGSWPFVQRLVDKYGLVPFDLYAGSPAFAAAPETLDQVLTTTLREHALLFKSTAGNAAQVAAVRNQALAAVFRVLSIFMGSPPPPPRQVFVWHFIDVFGNTRAVQCSPRAFAQDLQSPPYPTAHGDFLSRLVCIVHDPRHAEGTELMVGGGQSATSSTSLFRPYGMLNTSMADFQMACECMLKAGYPVFLGCDGTRALRHAKGSFLDVDRHDFALFFGQTSSKSAAPATPRLSKADRLRTGDSAMTHALVLTGVDTGSPMLVQEMEEQKGQKEKPATRRWRVQRTLRTIENRAAAVSSGPTDQTGQTGEAVLMTDAWMEEFVYLAAIDPQVLPAQPVQRAIGNKGGRYPGLSAKSATVHRTTTAEGEIREIFREANEAIVLAASDPMAAMVE